MELQINILTPKNQAAKCIDKHKSTLLGLTKINKVTRQKIISDHEFMWVVPIDNNAEAIKYQKRLALGEAMIKDFYKRLYRFIHVINRSIKLADKFGKYGLKGLDWVIRRTKKILITMIPDPAQRKEMMDSLESEIRTTEIKGDIIQPIKIDDQKQMDRLLTGDIISTKII